MLPATRVILYHKQSTSARTLFLTVNGQICLFDPLPPLSQLLDKTQHPPTATLAFHPAQLITQAEQQLNMESGSLKIEGEFHEIINTPDTPIHIYLARFTAIDPPREKVAEKNGKFIAITEARNITPPELALLRLAYQEIMEG